MAQTYIGPQVCSRVLSAASGYCLFASERSSEAKSTPSRCYETSRFFDHIDPARRNSDGHIWAIGQGENGSVVTAAPPVPDNRPPIERFTTHEIGADAQAILAAGGEARFPARNSVATFLTDGLDNAYAQRRARHALFYLYLNGHQWPAPRLGPHFPQMLSEAGNAELPVALPSQNLLFTLACCGLLNIFQISPHSL